VTNNIKNAQNFHQPNNGHTTSVS